MASARTRSSSASFSLKAASALSIFWLASARIFSTSASPGGDSESLASSAFSFSFIVLISLFATSSWTFFLSSWAWSSFMLACILAGSEGSVFFVSFFSFAAANSFSISLYAASALSILALASARSRSACSFAAAISARVASSSCCSSSDLFACALAESNAAAVMAPLSASFLSNAALASAASASSASTRVCSASALAACVLAVSAFASSLAMSSASLALSSARRATRSASVFRSRFFCVATARSSASRSFTPSAMRFCAVASSSLSPVSLSLSFLTRPAETFSFFRSFSSSAASVPSGAPCELGDLSATAAIALACSSSPSRSVIRRVDAPSASFMASLISSSRSTAAWVRSVMGERSATVWAGRWDLLGTSNPVVGYPARDVVDLGFTRTALTLHCACRVSFAICSMSSSSCLCCSLR